MNKQTIILLILIAVFFGWIDFTKQSRHVQMLIEKDKTWQTKIDSLETAYKDSLHSRELFFLQEFTKAIKSADRAIGQAEYNYKLYLNEKNKHRSFTDTGRDSLVSAIGFN